MKEKKWILKKEYVAKSTNLLPNSQSIEIDFTQGITVDNPYYLPFIVRNLTTTNSLIFYSSFNIPSSTSSTTMNTGSIPTPYSYLRFKFYKDSNSKIVFAAEKYNENGEYLGDVIKTSSLTDDSLTLNNIYQSYNYVYIDYYEYTDDYDEDSLVDKDEENLLYITEAGYLKTTAPGDLQDEYKDYSAYPSNELIPLPYYVRRRNTEDITKPAIYLEYNLVGTTKFYTASKSFTVKESYTYFQVYFIEKNNYGYVVCRTFDKNGALLEEFDSLITSPGKPLAETAIKVKRIYDSSSKTFLYNYVPKTSIPISYEYITSRKVITDVNRDYNIVRYSALPITKEKEAYRLISKSGIGGIYEKIGTKTFSQLEKFTYCDIQRGDFIEEVELLADINVNSNLEASITKVKHLKTEIKTSSVFFVDTKRYIEFEAVEIKNNSLLKADKLVLALSDSDIKSISDLQAENKLYRMPRFETDIIIKSKLTAPISVITSLIAEFNENTITKAELKRFVRRDDKIITLVITKKYDFTTYIDDEAGLQTYKQ